VHCADACAFSSQKLQVSFVMKGGEVVRAGAASALVAPVNQ
jgi:hypothetical protein